MANGQAAVDDGGLAADTAAANASIANPNSTPLQSQSATPDDGLAADTAAANAQVQQPLIPSATGMTTEPLPNYKSGWVDFTEHIMGGAKGLSGITPGLDLYTTDKTFEDAQKEWAPQQHDIEQMHKEDADNTLHYIQANNWAAAAGTTIEHVIEENTIPTAVSLGGGVVGAALTRSPVGFLAGTGAVGGVMSLASTTYALREHGADPETARIGGLAAGLAGFASSFIGTGQLTKPVLAALKTPAVKQTAFQFFLKMAKAAGLNFGVMEVNNFIDAGIKLFGTLHSSPDKKYTPAQIVEEFKQASVNALVMSPTLAALFGGAGKLLANRKTPGVSPDTALKTVTAELLRRDRLVAEEARRAEYDNLYGKGAAEELRKKSELLSGRVEITEQGEPKALIGDIQFTQNEKEVVHTLLKEILASGQFQGDPEELQAKLFEWVARNRYEPSAITDKSSPEKIGQEPVTVKVKEPRTKKARVPIVSNTSFIQKAINALPKNKNGAPQLGDLINQLVQEVTAVFQGRKPVKMESTANPINSLLNLPQRLAYRLNASNSSFDGLLDIAGQDSPPEDRIVLQGLSEYLHDVYHRVEQANREGIERLNEHLEEATGLDKAELQEQVAKMGSTKLKDLDGDTIKYHNFLTGGVSEYKNVSEIEALQDYAWAQDPDAQDGLRARGFTLRGDFPLTETDPITGEVKEVLTTDPDTGEIVPVDDPRTWELQVESALGPEKLKLIKGAVAESNEAGPELQEAFKQKTGKTLQVKAKDTYFGRIVRKHAKPDNAFDDYMFQLENATVGKPATKKTQDPSITIQRVKNAIPTAPTNFYLNAVTNIKMRNQLVYTWQAGEVFNGVFNNPTVRSIVQTKGGKQLEGMIDASIDEGLHGPTKAEVPGDELTNLVLKHFGSTWLGNNIGRSFMHLHQLPMYAVAKNMDAVKLAAGVTDFWFDPVGNTKQVMNRPFAKGRYESAMKTFLNAVQSDDPSTFLRGKIDQAQMIWLPLGDAGAVVQGWHAVFVTERGLGKSVADAARAADIATDSVMYSSSSPQLSQFGAGRVFINGKVYRISATKLVAIAAQIPTKMFELQVNAIRDAIQYPTAKNIAHAAAVMLAVRTANAGFAGVKLAWDLATLRKKERREKAIRDFITETIVGPLPPVEKVLTAAPIVAIRNSVLHKKDSPAEWSVYVQKVMNDISSVSTEASTAQQKHFHSRKANEEVTKTTLKVINETALGIGVAPIAGTQRIMTGK
jgi:hypothetical protein